MDDNGLLPKDATGVPWSGPEELLRSQIRFVRISDEGRRISAPYRLLEQNGIALIVPDRGFLVGQRYFVSIRERHPRERQKVRRQHPEIQFPPAEISSLFTVSGEKLALHSAGVTISLPRREWLQFGASPECSRAVDAVVIDVSVSLPSDVEAFRSYLLYQTYVDGVPWMPTHHLCDERIIGRSWTLLPGTDMLFLECGGDQYGLPPGRHTIQVRIMSPDGRLVVASAQEQFEIECINPPHRDNSRASDPSEFGTFPQRRAAEPTPTLADEHFTARRRAGGCSVNHRASVADVVLGFLASILGLFVRGRSRPSRCPPRPHP